MSAFASPYQRRTRSASRVTGGASRASFSGFSTPRSIVSSLDGNSAHLRNNSTASAPTSSPPLHTNWEFYINDRSLDESADDFVIGGQLSGGGQQSTISRRTSLPPERPPPRGGASGTNRRLSMSPPNKSAAPSAASDSPQLLIDGSPSWSTPPSTPRTAPIGRVLHLEPQQEPSAVGGGDRQEQQPPPSILGSTSTIPRDTPLWQRYLSSPSGSSDTSPFNPKRHPGGGPLEASPEPLAAAAAASPPLLPLRNVVQQEPDEVLRQQLEEEDSEAIRYFYEAAAAAAGGGGEEASLGVTAGEQDALEALEKALEGAPEGILEVGRSREGGGGAQAGFEEASEEAAEKALQMQSTNHHQRSYSMVESIAETSVSQGDPADVSAALNESFVPSPPPTRHPQVISRPSFSVCESPPNVPVEAPEGVPPEDAPLAPEGSGTLQDLVDAAGETRLREKGEEEEEEVALRAFRAAVDEEAEALAELEGSMSELSELGQADILATPEVIPLPKPTTVATDASLGLLLEAEQHHQEAEEEAGGAAIDGASPEARKAHQEALSPPSSGDTLAARSLLDSIRESLQGLQSPGPGGSPVPALRESTGSISPETSCASPLQDKEGAPSSAGSSSRKSMAHMKAAGVRDLVAGKLTPDRLRRSLQPWERSLEEELDRQEREEQQHVAVWSVNSPTASQLPPSSAATLKAAVPRDGAMHQSWSVGPVLPPPGFSPLNSASNGIPTPIIARSLNNTLEDGYPDGALAKARFPHSTAFAPHTHGNGNGSGGSALVSGSSARVPGFQPLSEKDLCLADDAAYREVEAEIARALEELTRQQDGDTDTAMKRRRRAEAIRQQWRTESAAAAERLRLAGQRLVAEASDYQKRMARASSARERLQRELEAAVAEASELSFEASAAELAAEGAALGASAANKVHEEAERLHQWAAFGEASVLADAKHRLSAACEELARCKTVARTQKSRTAETRVAAGALAHREGRLAELCQDLIRLVELADLSRAHDNSIILDSSTHSAGVADRTAMLGSLRVSPLPPTRRLRSSGGSLNSSRGSSPTASGKNPTSAARSAAESCRALARELQPEEAAVSAAVSAAVDEAEEGSTGSSRQARSAEAVYAGIAAAAKKPTTTAEAQLHLAQVLEDAEGAAMGEQLAGANAVREAAQELQCELGPAQQVAMALLVTRMREVRASLNSRSVELVRSESAVSAAAAMIQAITRRRAAAETEVERLEAEHRRTLSALDADDVQKYALALQDRAKEQAGRAAGAAAAQLSRLEGERRRIVEEMDAESETLAELRRTLEGCWAEVTAAQAAYRRVRLTYQRRIARIFSGLDYAPGTDSSIGSGTAPDATSGILDGASSMPHDLLSSPPNVIHGALAELLSRAEYEELRAPFSLERGAEPMPLPEAPLALSSLKPRGGIIPLRQSRVDKGLEQHPQKPLPQQQRQSQQQQQLNTRLAADRISTGSSVLLGASYHHGSPARGDPTISSPASTMPSSVGSVGTSPESARTSSTMKATVASSSAALSTPGGGGGSPIIVSQRATPGPPPPAAARPRPHKEQLQQAAASRSSPRKGPQKVQPKKKKQGAGGGRGSSGQRASGAATSQWRLLEPMIRGQELLVLEGGSSNASWTGLRRSTANSSFLMDHMDHNASRDSSELHELLGQPTSVTLSGDYSRLVLRRHGCALSTFVRMVEIVGFTDKGKKEVLICAEPPPNGNGSKGSGDRAPLTSKALLTFAVHMSERTVSFACRSRGEHEAWLEGLRLLLAHKEKLPRLKASMAPFQHPYLFANAKALRP